MNGGRRIFAIAFVLALIAFLPLRLVMGSGGGVLSAHAARGSVWHGQLTETAIAGQSLGDLQAGLSPLHLFLGQARVKLSGALNGAIIASFGGRGADIDSLNLPLLRRLGPVRINALELADAHIHYRGASCSEADGRATILVEGATGAQRLSGPLKCAGGVLAADLLSQSAMERLTLRFPDGGKYEAAFTIKASDVDQAARLNAAGFRETATGHIVRFSGTL